MDDELANILNEPPDPKFPYTYRGTKTLINKFGILNPDALERVVRAITGLRVEMLRNSPIEGNFDLEHLCKIHRYLFQDVYDWAGNLREVDFKRNGMTNPLKHLSKVGFDFTKSKPVGPPFYRVDQIVPEAISTFDELRREHHLKNLTQHNFADRLTYFLSQLYIIHPFRDGNGRTIRAFLGQLANESGWSFDLEAVPQLDRHLTAFAAHCGDIEPLRNVVRQSVAPLQARHNETP